jgi:hypothetical protein
VPARCLHAHAGRAFRAALLAAIDPASAAAQPRLVDEAGFPVFVAEVEGLDVGAVAERLQVGLPAQEAWLASDEVLRSLALLDGVLREALQRLAGLAARPGLQLRCICLLPAHWDTAHFPWLHSWLQRSYFAGFAPGRCELSLVLAADDAAALRTWTTFAWPSTVSRTPSAWCCWRRPCRPSTPRVVAGWAARGAWPRPITPRAGARRMRGGAPPRQPGAGAAAGRRHRRAGAARPAGDGWPPRCGGRRRPSAR